MTDVPKAGIFCSQRWSLAVLAALGHVFLYVARVNLSVAILCMVKSDDVIDGNSTSSNENVTGNQSHTGSSCGYLVVTSGGTSNDRGEFTWDKATQSRILSMYYYGYILTQIPGAWMALRFGGKQVWGVSMMVTALGNLAMPISARTHVYLLYALRFLMGLAGGVTVPCAFALLGRWTPPYERSKLYAYTFAGPLVGSVATLTFSGVLCENGFDNGWGSIFYLSGGSDTSEFSLILTRDGDSQNGSSGGTQTFFNIIWVVLWFFLTANSPEQHKRIKKKELEYIQHAIGTTVSQETRKIPWAAIIRSRPLLAIIICHFGNNYTNYILLISLPAFMKESLKFDIKQNGLVSSLPFVSQMLVAFMVGYAADTIREKRWFTTRTIRKTFQTGSFTGIAVCMSLVGLMDCSQRYLAVFLLCLGAGFMSFSMAGYVVNHLDLAPSYAGILMGITNTAATIPGIISPIIAGALTPNKSAEEWRNVFYLCAAIATAAAIVYLLFAEGELQTWAHPELIKAINTETIYSEPKKIFFDDAASDTATTNRKVFAIDVDNDDQVHIAVMVSPNGSANERLDKNDSSSQ